MLLAAAAMWAIERMVRPVSISLPYRTMIAAMIGMLGITVIVLGVVAFRSAKTTVNPLHPERASALVAEGVYRVTRNPMYLGMLLVLIGWAIYLANVAGVVVLALFVAYMNRFQITPEERALEVRFGSEFADYRRRVRRWL